MYKFCFGIKFFACFYTETEYPHLVTGAIAASAPILQFITDCNRFNMIVSSVFTVDQGNCARNIRQTWDVLRYVT